MRGQVVAAGCMWIDALGVEAVHAVPAASCQLSHAYSNKNSAWSTSVPAPGTLWRPLTLDPLALMCRPFAPRPCAAPPQNNVVIELNALKIAEDRTFADCAKYMLTALLNLALPPPPKTPAEYAPLFKTGEGGSGSAQQQVIAMDVVQSSRSKPKTCGGPVEGELGWGLHGGWAAGVLAAVPTSTGAMVLAPVA